MAADAVEAAGWTLNERLTHCVNGSYTASIAVRDVAAAYGQASALAIKQGQWELGRSLAKQSEALQAAANLVRDTALFG